jgi:hypothetical protein
MSHWTSMHRRQETNFRWEDNTTAPASVVSSFQDYAGADYAHWAKYMANGPVTAEPQNYGNDNESCVVAAQPAEFGYPPYYYFNGQSKADRVGVELHAVELHTVHFIHRLETDSRRFAPGALKLHRDWNKQRLVWLA